jgi:hypothetical protein
MYVRLTTPASGQSRAQKQHPKKVTGGEDSQTDGGEAHIILTQGIEESRNERRWGRNE